MPIPDLIFSLFCAIRSKGKKDGNLNFFSMIPTINFIEIGILIFGDLKESSVKEYFLKLFLRDQKKYKSGDNNKNDKNNHKNHNNHNSNDDIENIDEISMENIVILGLKYPLLFYELLRFQRNFKRRIFGDLFSVNKKILKSKLFDENDKLNNSPIFFTDFQHGFENEKNAINFSAKNILIDIYNITISFQSKLLKNRLETVTNKNIKSKIKNEIENTINSKVKKNYGIANIKQIVNVQNCTDIQIVKKFDNDQTEFNFFIFEKSHLNLSLNTNLKKQTDTEIIFFRETDLTKFRLKLELSVRTYDNLEFLSDLFCIHLKDLLGYRISRSIVLDSKIKFEYQPFLE